MKFNKLLTILSEEHVQKDMFDNNYDEIPKPKLKRILISQTAEIADGKSSFEFANFFKINAYAVYVDNTEEKIPIILSKSTYNSMKAMMAKHENTNMIYNFLLKNNHNLDYGYKLPKKLSQL